MTAKAAPTSLTAAVADLDQAQADLRARIGEAEDAETTQQAQLDLLRSGTGDVSADAIARGEAEIKRSTLRCLAAHDRVKVAQEQVKAAQLADALQEGRDYDRGPVVAEIQAAAKELAAAERKFNSLIGAHQATKIRIGTKIRDAGGEHVQADADDGWIGRAGSRPEVCGFTADGVSLVVWQRP